MKIRHRPSHWIAVALVLAALLFTLNEAHGQGAGAAAVFEGRPAMAGAQGGLGAQAGPPQGGVGVQGSEAAERQLRLRRPSGLDGMAQASREDEVMAARDEARRPKDRSIAKSERSAITKGKRAAKRTIEQARTGTSPVDSTAQAGR